MYNDGAGLYLLVSDSLAKSWIFRYTRFGKQREMGLGALHTISLAEARVAAQEARKILLQGRCPLEEKRQLVQQKKSESANAKTFEQCGIAYIESHHKKWKNEKHIYQWRRTLEMYVYPHIGHLPISEITTSLVLRCLEPIWAEKSETATRLRQRIELIWNWAKVMGYCEGENPARWRGHLDNILPARRQFSEVKHLEALPYQHMAEFMKLLRPIESLGARALELCILTACRTSEVLNARWSEIDLDDGVWIIPPERMKAKREHRVALSSDAIRVLKQCKSAAQTSFVFPSPRGDKPLSNMVMMMAKRRIFERNDVPDALVKYKAITPHGFRSTFRDWAAEVSHYPREIAEMALAHAIENKVEAAYRRGDVLEKRRAMMEDWAKYCNGGTVLAFKPQLVASE